MQGATFWDTRRCRATGLALSLAWAFCAFPPISFEGTFWAGLSPVAQMALRLALVGLLPSLVIPLVPRMMEQGRARLVAVLAAIVLWVAGWLGNMALDASASLLLRFAALFFTGAGSAYFLVYWGLCFCRGDEEAGELDFATVIVLAGVLVIAAHLVMRPVLDAFLVVTPLLQGALLALEARQSRQPDGSRPAPADPPPVPAGSFALQLSALLLRTTLAIALVSFVWCMFSMNSTAFFQPEMHLFGFGFLLAGAAIWLFVKFSPSIGFVAATRWVLPMMALGLLCNAGSTVGSLVAACLLLSMAHATFEMLLRMQAVRFGRLHPERQVMAVGWGFSAIMLGAFVGPSLYLLVMDSGIVDGLHLALWVLTILVVVGSVLFAIPKEASVEGAILSGVRASGDGETGGAVRALGGSVAGASPDGGDVSDEAGPSVQQRAQQLAGRFGLTAREREILTLLLAGRSRPYIRDVLYLSLSTVDTHIRHIYAKAGVHNKQELIDLSQADES